MLPDLTLGVKSGQVSTLLPTPSGQDKIGPSSLQSLAIIASRTELTQARGFPNS